MSTALELHRKHRGKIRIESKVPVNNLDDLSLAYTPGVAEACKEIAKDINQVYEYTVKSNMVAVVTDGSAVLGLGNIGPEAALPVMEGKAILFKKFGGVDAFPICLKTQETEEIIRTVKLLEPVFGGINLEDIAAPKCFEIEERLKKELSIPVFHDDQHGSAIVVLASLINALKVVNKNVGDVKVVISGAGAAAIATSRLLLEFGFQDVTLVDSRGIISETREDLSPIKREMAKVTNKNRLNGSLPDALAGADIFVGLSRAGLVESSMVKTMNPNPIIIAMANPIPEIYPDEAKKGGAAVVATGRSDFPNQVNNVLVFPGLFRGVLDSRVKMITNKMKRAVAQALASLVKNPRPEKIIPSVFEEGVANTVAEAVKMSV